MEISINGIQMVISEEELEKILKEDCINWNMGRGSIASWTLLLYIRAIKKEPSKLLKSAVEDSKELLEIPDTELNSFEILVKKILILENELDSLSKVLSEKWHSTMEKSKQNSRKLRH